MSERIHLTEENIEEAVTRAAEVLRQGGIILYPTDTLYGLGADNENPEALKLLFSIKGRQEEKLVSKIVSDIDAAADYALVTPLAHKLSDHFLPGKLTIILKSGPQEEFSIRVPANAFCLFLADTFGKPFTATSANKSGERPEMNVDAILAQLGDASKKINLIIDAGELPESLPSTIVDARGEQPVIVREGAIPAGEILAL